MISDVPPPFVAITGTPKAIDSIIFVMIGSTNAVNLTDGVDGLAGSVSTIMCIGLSIIAVVVKYEEVSVYSSFSICR